MVPRLSKFRGNKDHRLPNKLTVSVVWADIDVGEGEPFLTIEDALKHLRKLELAPNIIVRSGTRLHVYYMLKKPLKMTTERLDRLLRSLAFLLRSDFAAARPSALMRVPHTHNWKRGRKGKLVVASYPARTRYRLKDLEAAWNVDDN